MKFALVSPLKEARNAQAEQGSRSRRPDWPTSIDLNDSGAGESDYRLSGAGFLPVWALLVIAAGGGDARCARVSAGSDRAGPLAGVLRRLDERAKAWLELRALSAALEGQCPPGGAGEELAAVVAELYDLIGRTREAIDMIERSARDLPELASLF